jgi:hypothetical protein
MEQQAATLPPQDCWKADALEKVPEAVRVVILVRDRKMEMAIAMMRSYLPVLQEAPTREPRLSVQHCWFGWDAGHANVLTAALLVVKVANVVAVV